MALNKAAKPSVTTFGDYEMITPPNPLRSAVSQVSDKDVHDDPVARAEKALAELSSEFSSWMNSECDRLDAARRDVKLKGFIRTTYDALFHAAHDIKGEAATFGYPFVAASADSLCRLIEYSPELKKIPLAIIDQHVDAIRAIVREHNRGDIAKIAGALVETLRSVTDEFLVAENQHRPEVLRALNER